MEVGRDVVRAALRAVPGPDGTVSLAQSPALSEITVVGDKVAFAIAVPADRAAEFETLRRAAEAAVRSVPGVGEVLVALTSERAPTRNPPPSGSGAAPVRQGSPASGGIPLPGIRHVVAVGSGKGGVGKSTTTANLALAMAMEGRRVGILDADVFGPSMPTLFGLADAKPRVVDGLMQPLTAYGLSIMSIGFLVEAATAMIWRGPMVMQALTQMLRDVAWGQLDVLLIDLPPGTGDAQLTIAQQARLAGAVIVSTPQDLALIDARRAVTMFQKVNVPILGLLENMSYFCCPNCGARSDIFGHGGARIEAEKLGVRFLGEIPLNASIRQFSDAGTPLSAMEPQSAEAEAYRVAARAVLAALQSDPLRAPPRIVIEA